MQWNESDAQGRQGVAVANKIISKLGHQFREQPTNDVGIDAHVEVVDLATRRATGQLVALQIKGGASFLDEVKDSSFIFRGDFAHLDYWESHSLPVFLVLVDTDKDKAYWQEITPNTVERLGKGWKVNVPFSNDLSVNFVVAARSRVGLDANAASYTRLTLEDSSNLLADSKRYRSSILMRAPVTRLRAEAVIRRATNDLRNERYSLEGFRSQFGNRDADVVSLYVAGDLNDAENSNWYCRTQWVSPNHAAGTKPVPIQGTDLSDGIEVMWNTDYAQSSQFYQGQQIDKQSFLDATRGLAAEVETLVQKTFGSGPAAICSPEEARKHAISMRDLYTQSNDVGLPPYECKEVAGRFGDIMAIADNAFVYATKILDDPSDKAWPVILESTLADYVKNRGRFIYELEKVR